MGKNFDISNALFSNADVAHHKSHVKRERGIVMAQMMADNMMDMQDARETWCVGATTVGSLEHTIMGRMTVVKDQQRKLVVV